MPRPALCHRLALETPQPFSPPSLLLPISVPPREGQHAWRALCLPLTISQRRSQSSMVARTFKFTHNVSIVAKGCGIWSLTLTQFRGLPGPISAHRALHGGKCHTCQFLDSRFSACLLHARRAERAAGRVAEDTGFAGNGVAIAPSATASASSVNLQVCLAPRQCPCNRDTAVESD